ncbi:MAG TPA: response regulator transcription factor [Pseudonocardiaceae bacterium]|jgi:DNA-binding NarL/FixJ family response regulator|nr:response regulator transcription factor [Pseudonocardiaceae bacterium]
MRVVIAEDSGVLRAGLVELLTSRGYQVPAAVSDGEALRVAVAEHNPDIAVVDIRMPPTFTDEGLRAAIELRDRRPGLAILLFSQYVETRHAARLLSGRPKGIGYLLKDRVADVREFVGALDRLVAGETVLDPEVVSQLLGAAGSPGLDTLTRREREVLELMAEGRSNTAVAKALVLSYGAVEKHVTNIFAKLGLPQSTDDHRRVLAVLRYLNPADPPFGGSLFPPRG